MPNDPPCGPSAPENFQVIFPELYLVIVPEWHYAQRRHIDAQVQVSRGVIPRRSRLGI